MSKRLQIRASLGLIIFLFINGAEPAIAAGKDTTEHRLLYVAVPGIRDLLEYGGHGILVFDMDHGHKFAKRIPASGLNAQGRPLNVKGICASSDTQRLYVSTTETLSCYDLLTDKLLWEKPYEGGCDRMAISPDGKVIYVPSFEKDHWHVVDGMNGDVIRKIVIRAGSHNTIIGPNGRFAYLAGLKSPLLRVSDTTKHEVIREIGPFSNVIRPFTINGKQKLCYVNMNDLLGFEIGDLKTGKMLSRIEVQGFQKGPVKRHGCPSHGIGLTPNEKEIWLADSANSRLHIFDITATPPKQVGSISLRDQPGWVTFSIDGRLAYPSTGEVIDVKKRKIVATLADETGAAVHSEKLLEIDFAGGRVIRAGNQFGIGGVTP